LRGKIKADFTSISRTRNPPNIDETGDRKKGDTTDYVTVYREFRKNRERIVAVTAYGLCEGMTFL